MNNTNSLVQSTVITLTLTWALFYARIRMAVFPVHFVYDDGGCSCESASCDRKGKHPMTAHGLHDATIVEEEVRNYFTGEPDANIGIRTGAESGVVVVDVDPRHGGLASLREMQAKYGALPPTVVVRTGGQGWHYYFRHPGGHLGNRQAVLPGIDVRGDGGYVVAPPSNHVAGDYAFEPGYGFNEIAVAEMPAWLRELVTGPAQPVATTTASAGSETISAGERNGTLFSMACSMRS